jgi:hypothetical protein
MSTRTRSWVGSILTLSGIVLLLAAAFTLRGWLLWAGILAAVPGIGLIIWAFRDAVRELGANQGRFEAMLRAQVPERREQKPPE